MLVTTGVTTTQITVCKGDQWIEGKLTPNYRLDIWMEERDT